MSRPAGLFVLFAAAACASAQVTLSTVQGGMVTPVDQGYVFGSVALGGAADVDFRLTNTGSSAVYLTSLALTGAYAPDFSVVCALSPDLCGGAAQQQLPILIDPAGTLDFTVQFQPLQLGISIPATMTIAAGNNLSIILSGAGVQGLTVLQNNQPLAAGQTISFAAVQVGSSQTIALMLANQTNALLAVPAIPPPAGAGFSVAGSALSATGVPPGSSTELDVIFTPTAAGPQQATLTIGAIAYPLEGTGLAPPPAVFPTPSIQLNLATPASAQQGSLSVSLASAAASSGIGTVTLALAAACASGGPIADPTVAFADGTTSATFTVAQGASAGQFAGGPSVSFGTGTTAGSLVFTVTLGSSTVPPTCVTIQPAIVAIDAAVATRNVGCAPSVVYCTGIYIQLQINGWDNTQPRSASQIAFTFFNSSGAVIQPSPIAVDETTAFQQYFEESNLGGVFGVNALFPVTGDSDLVVAASVQITNSVGTVQSATITF
jgi:hypothetical protein